MSSETKWSYVHTGEKGGGFFYHVHTEKQAMDACKQWCKDDCEIWGGESGHPRGSVYCTTEQRVANDKCKKELNDPEAYYDFYKLKACVGRPAESEQPSESQPVLQPASQPASQPYMPATVIKKSNNMIWAIGIIVLTGAVLGVTYVVTRD